jgi:hypothetical protein
MASDILTLNLGSSRLKFSLWQAGFGMELREVLRGESRRSGSPRIVCAGAQQPDGRREELYERGANLSHEDPMRELFAPAAAAWLGP